MTAGEGAAGVDLRALDGKVYRRTTEHPYLPPDLALKRLENMLNMQDIFRVKDGIHVKPKEWPWAAAFLDDAGAQIPFCVGAVIAPQWILTAGHCGVDDSDVVLVGVLNVLQTNAKRHRISRAWTASSNPSSRDADLALVRLCKPVTASVLPLTSGVPSLEAPPTYATVAGWGATESSSFSPNLLKTPPLPIVTNAECAEAYEGLVTDNMLCAGKKNGAGPCEGDSGSPLVVLDGSKKWLGVGVHIWPDACTDPHSYGVYTRVSRFFAWIDETKKLQAEDCSDE